MVSVGVEQMIISLYVMPPPRDTLTLKTRVSPLFQNLVKQFLFHLILESLLWVDLQLKQVVTVKITGVLQQKNIYSNVVVVLSQFRCRNGPLQNGAKLCCSQPQEILNKVLDTSNQLYPPKYSNSPRNLKKSQRNSKEITAKCKKFTEKSQQILNKVLDT